MGTRTWVKLIAATMCGMLGTGSADGAELRAKVQDRTVYRTASVQSEPAEQAAESVAPGSRSVIRESTPRQMPETMLDPTYDIGPSHEFGPAPGCPSCGVGGCSYGCLQICGVWGELEYLLWWRRGRSLPPLVTTSSDNTPLNQAGVLDLPETRVVFGNERVGDDAAPGGRVSIGTWIDACREHAIEGRFFAMGQETIAFQAASEGLPILARPFNNRDLLAGPLGPTSRPIAFPNIVQGQINITSESEILGGDVLLRSLVCDTGLARIEVLSGYQYARLEDDLLINDSLVDIDPNNIIVDGTQQDILDRFDTRNQFHGGVIGLESMYHGSCWRLKLLAKIAFGHMEQQVTVSGQTINNVPNDPNSPIVLQEGLLANAGNQGTYERNEFAVLPELGATLYFAVNDCIDLSVGYSFLYFDNVAQPGDQINQALFVPSQFSFVDSSFWLHGLNAGAEFRF